MAGNRDEISRDTFAHAVRRTVNTTLSKYDHHPHAGYTPAAFRHYIRELALLDTLARMRFSNVLDVGCAEGWFMKVIDDRFAVEVWGVDLSTVALAKARELYGFQVAAADATRLPFADGSFDLVYSTEVIEHMLDPDLMVAEMRRVSRGTVLVTTPVSQTPDEHEPDYALEAEGHVNNFDPATVRRLFGPEAKLDSFRCNATLASIVALGRHLPRGLRDGFYRLDHLVSQRVGSPDHRLKALRNRDWLITLPAVRAGDASDVAGAGTDAGASRPSWRCPACKGELREEHGTLVCTGCAAVYRVKDGVPDLFEPQSAG